MKKLVLMFAAVTAISFASCGNSTQSSTTTDSTVVDTADTVVVDSIVADSVAE